MFVLLVTIFYLHATDTEQAPEVHAIIAPSAAECLKAVDQIKASPLPANVADVEAACFQVTEKAHI